MRSSDKIQPTPGQKFGVILVYIREGTLLYIESGGRLFSIAVNRVCTCVLNIFRTCSAGEHVIYTRILIKVVNFLPCISNSCKMGVYIL